MDRFFYNCYYEYFLWNKGLIEYFFKKGKSEILFYIDSQLLKEIGRSKGIEAVDNDYKKEFISSVEYFCAHYNRYICNKKYDPKVCENSDCRYYSCLGRDKRSDVLAVANHIYSKSIKYYDKYEDETGSIKIRKSEDGKALVHDMPFFAIVIYIILKFDNGKTQEWDNVGEQISSISRPFIPKLWEGMSRFDSRFDKDASVYDHSNSEYGDYAGRILYHLPLSASTRNKIQDAIYKSSAWKLVDSKSFHDIVGLITNSLKDNRANKELKDILLSCFLSNNYKGVSIRKVQSVIDDFDIDAYESRMVERKKSKEYEQTVVSGEFALGIYFPNNDEQKENSLVLLTTVQQNVNLEDFCISEGRSGTLAGYNTSFVRIKGKVELKDYTLYRKNYYCIKSMPTKDVIFFYEYDDTLFIQTRVIKPAKSYIIAVRKSAVSDFNQWCEKNENTLVQLPNEDTKELFGDNWTIFYTECKLNGQYYGLDVSVEKESQESTSVIMKGGIKKNNGCYFINALPYFEIPSIYNPKDIKVFMNLNGVYDESIYIWKTVDNKIILDIKEMPIDSSEIAYVDICLEYNGKTISCYSINICGQSIIFDLLNAYKFDQFGISTRGDSLYFGNHIDEKYQLENAQGIFQINKDRFDSISEDLYFTNLLAACCYDSVCSEITHAKFRKCVSYAAVRLNIDIQKEGFISNIKRILSKAGVLHIDYSTGKCQAIVPSFMRVPFSSNQIPGCQLIMLCGCYTRAFIADLIKYCGDDRHHVEMFCIKNKSQSDEEKLLPPIILLDHNFSPKSFYEEYKQCDVLDDHDFALSLLNMVPSYKDICSRFQFQKNDSYQFLSQLEPITTISIPRIRSRRNTSTHKFWYIERSNNEFALIEQGLLSWASIICHHEMNIPMVIKQGDYSIYLPMTLMLPDYIERALYLMNLGLPKTQKVFLCGAPNTAYYILMNQYKLYDERRCNMFASKISGNEDNGNHVRNVVRTTHRMEVYRSNFNGSKYREMYMILKDCKRSDEILAVAYNHKVYLNCQGRFYRLNARTVNEAMSFLIQGGLWSFESGRKSIGYSKKGGQIFESVFDLTNEEITMPNLSQFHKEDIQII